MSHQILQQRLWRDLSLKVPPQDLAHFEKGMPGLQSHFRMETKVSNHYSCRSCSLGQWAGFLDIIIEYLI